MSAVSGEPAPATQDPALGADERAELERLRAETQRLRAEAEQLRGQARAEQRRRRLSWRAPVAVLLIVLGCVLAPVSVLGVWTASQVSDTSRYVANIEPLIHEPAVQNALTDKITTQVTSHLNVAGYVHQASGLLTSKGLPRVGALLNTFTPSLASAVTGYIHNTVHKIVTGPAFARAWIQVNTVAHQTLVKALSGRGGAIIVSNGQVVIDLAPFINIVKTNLAARGFTLVDKLPPIHPTLALFSSKALVRAQTLYRFINDLKIVLPILSLLLLGLGVYVARRHRRALIGAGLGVAVSMLVLGAGLLVARGIYLNTVPSNVLPSDAAAVMFDTLVRFIREALRALLVAGLVVAAAAFLIGPSTTAVQIRKGFTRAFAWLRRAGERGGLDTGPVGLWTYQHRKALRIAAVALAALLFVFWGRPTAAVVILLTVLLLVVLGLIELVGKRPAVQPSATPHT